MRKFVLTWAKHYFASKDAFEKKIKTISVCDDKLIIEYKDKTEIILAYPQLNHLNKAEMKLHTTIITLNNRNNVDALYAKWHELKHCVEVKIYFINPFSTTDKRWIIHPNVHSKICEEADVKTGLMALFGSVEPLTPEILRQKLAIQCPKDTGD